MLEVIVKIERDSEEAVTTQAQEAVDLHPCNNSVTSFDSNDKKEEDMTLKAENEDDEVTIKQEFIIEPTVLQPQTAPDPLWQLSQDDSSQLFERPNTSSWREAKPPSFSAIENRVSQMQLNELLNYLQRHQKLVKCMPWGPMSQETKDRLWTYLARRLNAQEGCRKSGLRWKRYWADLKHKVKIKAAARRWEADRAGTTGGGGGGGCLNEAYPCEIERRVRALVGDGAVLGDSQHHGPVNFSPKSTESLQPVSAFPSSTKAQNTSLSVTSTEENIFSETEHPRTIAAEMQATTVPIVVSASARGQSEPMSFRITSMSRHKELHFGGKTDIYYNLERRRTAAKETIVDAMTAIAEEMRAQARGVRAQAAASKLMAEVLANYLEKKKT